ncbi:OB-fold domain-containing protein [Micromonospora sp. WMMA1363]|uniref:bifunctional MaoC family dehydratase N-terminal/OB-fold nucleic acid binding domain-containing protein n=1 Tax=Micromonospora sp. WMMA1363 TaxID=3053985 RepID=UPI00259D3145|nr:OB-fold domain-containing protein [Micromonospora sp. WMMA1363]MDM4719423.1 OB-fold domain-containing protein [Micromonospora sp. WMMA1363]
MEGVITAAAERIRAAGEGPSRHARDPVNLPMIRNWLEAMGDGNPVYERTAVAPPAMTQVWTMRGLRPAAEPADPLTAMSAVLDQAGFTSVVATNCEQTYHRYLRHGERLEVRSRLVDVIGPKRTALGEGWFVTTESTWYVGEEAVASMTFRVLKFRPPNSPAVADTGAPPRPAAAPDVLRPVVTADTAFFWAGTTAGELRIQRCGGCGALRHPPGPACPRCGTDRPEHVVARGTGEIFSFVVHHHPPVPGRRLPIVVAVVELTEGVRVVGEVLAADPARVRIGAAVRVDFVRVDAELTLPAWRLLP